MNAMPKATRRGAGPRLIWWLAAAQLLAAVPVPAAAQEPEAPGRADPAGVRLYVGMWSTHFRDLRRGLSNNWLIGLGWGRFYGGTFVNSFGHRSFTAGIQRTVAKSDEDGAIVRSFGYRLGVVSGYDERFISIASWTPVLPLAQLLGSLETGRTGLDVGWAGLVGTVGPSFRF